MAPTIVQDYQQQLIQTIIDLSQQQNWWSSPLNLGGGEGPDGGSGIPVGNIFGQLIQSKVAFDTTEAAVLNIPISGASLVTNLDRIRYRLQNIEGSGGVYKGVGILENSIFLASGVTNLNFVNLDATVLGMTATISGDLGGGVGPHTLGSATHTDVDTTGVILGDALVYDGSDWVPSGIAGGHSAVTVLDTASLNLELTGQALSGYVIEAGLDHGLLAGLGDDDHPQYSPSGHLHDSRYYLESEVDALLALQDELSELDDASVGGVAQGEILTWDGGLWVPSGVTGSGLDHGLLSGLGDDDHSIYLLADGTRQLGNDWDAGSNAIQFKKAILTNIDGNPPLEVTSTTLVTNLNADRVDSKHESAFLLVDGSRGLSASWDAGAHEIRALTLNLDEPSAAPMTIASAFVVANLNADRVDGAHASEFILDSLADAANDFLVASGADNFVKKTLAETATILEAELDHGSLQGLGDDDHAIYPNRTAGETITGLWDFNSEIRFTIHADPSATSNEAKLWASDVAAGKADLEMITEYGKKGRIFNAVTTVSHNLTQAIGSGGGWDRLYFNIEVADDEGWHSTSSNTDRITVHEAGEYLCMVFIKFASNTSGRRLLQIKDSGGNVWCLMNLLPASGDFGMVAFGQRAMAAGAYVYVEADTTSAVNVQQYPRFTLIKIH